MNKNLSDELQSQLPPESSIDLFNINVTAKNIEAIIPNIISFNLITYFIQLLSNILNFNNKIVYYFLKMMINSHWLNKGIKIVRFVCRTVIFHLQFFSWRDEVAKLTVVDDPLIFAPDSFLSQI